MDEIYPHLAEFKRRLFLKEAADEDEDTYTMGFMPIMPPIAAVRAAIPAVQQAQVNQIQFNAQFPGQALFMGRPPSLASRAIWTAREQLGQQQMQNNPRGWWRARLPYDNSNRRWRDRSESPVNGGKSIFHEAYEPTEEEEMEEEKPIGEPLDLMSIGSRALNMVFKKLSYQEIGRMEETCSTMKEYAHASGIKGPLEFFELLYQNREFSVAFKQKIFCEYDLQEIIEQTSARVHVKILRIECDMSQSTLKRIKDLLQKSNARAEKVIIGQMEELDPPLIEHPEIFEILTLVRAKHLFVNYRLRHDDIRRPEIKALMGLEIIQPVEFGLTPPLLRETPCPTIRIGWNDVASETVTSLLQQWKSGTRSIKCLTVDETFSVQEILNPDDETDLEAQALWTYYEQDKRIVDFLPMGKGANETDAQILLLSRGHQQRTAEDYLILFFGKYRFIAATLDGIIVENVLEALVNL